MTVGEIVLLFCLLAFTAMTLSASLVGVWPAIDDEDADPSPFPVDARD